jgi:hypothetical protein
MARAQKRKFELVTAIALGPVELPQKAFKSLHQLDLIKDLPSFMAADPAEKNKTTITPLDQIGTCMALVIGCRPEGVFKAGEITTGLQGKATSYVDQKIFFLGMTTLMALVKPITPNNREYITRRWKAAIAAMNVPDQLQADIPTLVNSCIAAAQDIERHGMEKAFVRAAASSLIRGKKTTSPWPEIMDQIDMVYSMTGMQSLQEMARFIDRKNKMSFTNLHVLEDAEKFLDEWNAVVTSPDYEYSAIFSAKLPKHKDYPDLYHSAITSGKHDGELKNFQLSAVATRTDKATLDRLCKLPLAPMNYTLLTQTVLNKMAMMGIPASSLPKEPPNPSDCQVGAIYRP